MGGIHTVEYAGFVRAIHTCFTQSVLQVVLQRSILTQIRPQIMYISKSKE